MMSLFILLLFGIFWKPIMWEKRTRDTITTNNNKNYISKFFWGGGGGWWKSFCVAFLLCSRVCCLANGLITFPSGSCPSRVWGLQSIEIRGLAVTASAHINAISASHMTIVGQLNIFLPPPPPRMLTEMGPNGSIDSEWGIHSLLRLINRWGELSSQGPSAKSNPLRASVTSPFGILKVKRGMEKIADRLSKSSSAIPPLLQEQLWNRDLWKHFTACLLFLSAFLLVPFVANHPFSSLCQPLRQIRKHMDTEMPPVSPGLFSEPFQIS